MIRSCCLVALCFGASSAALTAKRLEDSRLNVLMIVIDDLRPELNVYGRSPWMHTPNMDRLAAEGVTFARHYVQYACASPTAAFLRERSFAPRPTE